MTVPDADRSATTPQSQNSYSLKALQPINLDELKDLQSPNGLVTRAIISLKENLPRLKQKLVDLFFESEP